VALMHSHAPSVGTRMRMAGLRRVPAPHRTALKTRAIRPANCRVRPSWLKLKPERQSARCGSLRIGRQVAVVFFCQLRANIVQLLHDRVVPWRDLRWRLIRHRQFSIISRGEANSGSR